MKQDLDAAAPLLENDQPDADQSKFKRKNRQDAFGTGITNFNTNLNLDKFYQKDEKLEKIEKEKNRFLPKVYLHILSQSIIISVMLFLTFTNLIFYKIIVLNNYVFYAILIMLLVTFIRPLISDAILKNAPQNYIYLFIFTICLTYIICKFAIMVDFSLVKITSILNVVEILYLTIESYIVKKSEKNETDIANTATFMGLCLLFIGSIYCFLYKISILHFSIILLILVSVGVYIIYDMNCIFTDKRRKFQKNEYVLATMFLYIDIFQTLFELLEKFYNSCEPERKPINKAKKSMIYTGDEDYQNLYKTKEEEEKEKEKKENNLRFNVRRNSSTDFKRKYKILPQSNVIEEKEEDMEEKDISEEKDNQEQDISFKKQSEHVLTMDDNEEDNNNEV
jgi:FtsH-binding integral membrane protein